MNTVMNYISHFISILIVFFLTPIMLRELGTEDFGLWTLVFSVLGFFSLLDLGLNVSAVKYVAECRGSGQIERCKNSSNFLERSLHLVM